MIPSGKAEFSRVNMENSRMLCFLGRVDSPLDLFKVLQGRDTRRQSLATTNSLLKKKFRSSARQHLQGLTTSQARQPHGFETLARVGLDELKEIMGEVGEDSFDEMRDKLIVEITISIESVLQRAFQLFPDDPLLLAMESEYRDVLRQHDKAEVALKRAFERNPRLEWIAIRLADKFSSAGATSAAEAVLKTCIDANPGSRAAHYAMSKLLIAHGKEDDNLRILEHLGRSFTKGDVNYDAQFWYARQCFLMMRFEDATRYFESLKHAPLSTQVRNDVRGIVKNYSGETKRFSGVILREEEAYIFIRPEVFAINIFAHRGSVSKDSWEKFHKGMKVEFSIGFNMRGPVAREITPL